MKKLLAAASLGLLLAGASVTGALAQQPEDAGPGPNDHNNHGLCTAVFNGQKNGHAEGSDAPGPFGPLYDTSQTDAPKNQDDDDNNDVTGISALYDYCQQFIIGGNPGENGRYTDCFNGDSDEDGDPCNDAANAG